MNHARLFGAVCSVVVVASSVSEAGTVFVSSLAGPKERPVPTNSPGLGDAVLDLTGTPGQYVLTYTVSYTGLTSAPIDGHIHYSVAPPGQTTTEQVGPIVTDLDNFPSANTGASGTITGDWRFDDAMPLTDDLVDSLFDEELYFNLQTDGFATGEIRGQIVPGSVTPIPLPPSVWSGLIGLGAVGWSTLRKKTARVV